MENPDHTASALNRSDVEHVSMASQVGKGVAQSVLMNPVHTATLLVKERSAIAAISTAPPSPSQRQKHISHDDNGEPHHPRREQPSSPKTVTKPVDWKEGLSTHGNSRRWMTRTGIMRKQETTLVGCMDIIISYCMKTIEPKFETFAAEDAIYVDERKQETYPKAIGKHHRDDQAEGSGLLPPVPRNVQSRILNLVSIVLRTNFGRPLILLHQADTMDCDNGQ
ncbi:MAG: hypothetical protein J3Q66DRAFT_400960 [Benniella sp.]|nr:MAG: hypothetical protein J3Q66DRAFT_400956 [Benniella sp.]KAK3817600.1 MAG: hypothetical protein J3Q66DRAFT_400960 [Benniella sp.]